VRRRTRAERFGAVEDGSPVEAAGAQFTCFYWSKSTNSDAAHPQQLLCTRQQRLQLEAEQERRRLPRFKQKK
jgi:hypothetical protein